MAKPPTMLRLPRSERRLLAPLLLLATVGFGCEIEVLENATEYEITKCNGRPPALLKHCNATHIENNWVELRFKNRHKLTLELQVGCCVPGRNFRFAGQSNLLPPCPSPPTPPSRACPTRTSSARIWPRRCGLVVQ